MFIDIERLTEQLKNRAFFEKIVSPTQVATVMAVLFTLMATTTGALFLIPLLWYTITDKLTSPGAYTIIFNAKMGSGLALFLGGLALLSQKIAKKNRKPLLDTLYQTYLNKPEVYTIKSILRRGNVVLCAYATNPEQQRKLEQTLVQILQTNQAIYTVTYARISSASMKHKAFKMDHLKKKIINHHPALATNNFSLNCFRQTQEKGDYAYCLHLPGLLPMREHYLQFELNQLLKHPDILKQSLQPI